jgi:hypothetical protein
MVMERHKGYAVLMSEDSQFVKAADLHYEVGQTVTDPVIMASDDNSPSAVRRTVIKIAAAAACIAVTVFSGYQFYSRNMTDYIRISSSAAGIEIHVDKSGSVVALTSDTPYGKEIIRQYRKQNISRSDRADVANELLAIQIKQGYIPQGDTIELYVDADNTNELDSYRNEIEKEIEKLDLRVSDGVKDKTPKKDKKPVPDDKKADPISKDPPAPEEAKKPEEPVKSAPEHAVDDDKPDPPIQSGSVTKVSPEPPVQEKHDEHQLPEEHRKPETAEVPHHDVPEVKDKPSDIPAAPEPPVKHEADTEVPSEHIRPDPETLLRP